MTAEDRAKFQKIYDEAKQAGLTAGNTIKPRPMTVVSHVNPLDDHSEVGEAWFVPDGVCGFASVIIKPATQAFARWLKEKGIAKKHYYGGYYIWIGEHGQSLQRKEAHAKAMSKVFNEHGIRSYVESRLD